nr:hypothetical protein [Sphingomonas sp. CDS-1]
MRIARSPVAGLPIPELLAGPSVERDSSAIGEIDENLVALQRQPSRSASTHERRQRSATKIDLWLELPKNLAGLYIDGIDTPTRGAFIGYAVSHEYIAHRTILGRKINAPCKAKACDILLVDLIDRAVEELPRTIAIQPPFGWVRSIQDLPLVRRLRKQSCSATSDGRDEHEPG